MAYLAKLENQGNIGIINNLRVLSKSDRSDQYSALRTDGAKHDMTLQRGAKKLQLHNIGQFLRFESAFFWRFSHNVRRFLTVRLVLSHYLYASCLKTCCWPEAEAEKKVRTRWIRGKKKGSKLAEDMSKEEAREIEGNRGRGRKTDLQRREIEVRTRKEGKGWRRWWVMELERGKHSILLTSLEDVAETWSLPRTGHRSAALSNIGDKHTHTHSHTLSCNTAPGVFLKLTKENTRTHPWPTHHKHPSIFFATYLSLIFLSYNLLCLSSWIVKKLSLSHGTGTFKRNIMRLKSAGRPHVRLWLLDAETEDWLLPLRVLNIHFDEGKIINRLLLLTAALMLMRKECYFETAS